MTVSGPTNSAGTLLATESRIATTDSELQENLDCAGIILNVVSTTIAGGQTITPAIQALNEATGAFVTIHSAFSAISGAGTTSYTIYPTVANSATQNKNTVVPRYWRLRMTHSAGGTHVYSAGFSYVK